MTTDLCSPSLKNKKHYNSFSPALGFWLPLEKVKGWVEGTSDSTAGSQMGDCSATGLNCMLFCPSFWTADDNSNVCISSRPAPSRSKQGEGLIYCIISPQQLDLTSSGLATSIDAIRADPQARATFPLDGRVVCDYS